MKKTALTVILCCIVFLLDIPQSKASENNNDITGFWKTISEKTGMPECIIAIYEYQGQCFGRILITYFDDGSLQDTVYHPKKRAPGVVGNPYYSGLDILWGLKPKGAAYKNGNILDPLKGNIYRLEARRKGDRLVVKGIWFIFWRNQIWLKALDADFPKEFEKPDLASLIPLIPKVH